MSAGGIRQDWDVNRNNRRVAVGLLLLRAAQAVRTHLGRRNPLSTLVSVLYRSYSEVVGGFELPVSTTIGPRFSLQHGYGVVINKDTVIGADVVVRQHVSIGNRGPGGGCPTIGDRVSIGAGATIVGPVVVGDGATIGAHALVTTDVPAGGRAHAPRTVLSGPDDADA